MSEQQPDYSCKNETEEDRIEAIIKKYREALQWAVLRMDIKALRREGYGRAPDRYEEVRKLAFD